ncbi:MAG: HAMP domain-containing protein [Candidatus Zixiibacteriota bacterium]|nr:MAG: HAMP domain-containing protein [candidate division Zixibacteria bacterium]
MEGVDASASEGLEPAVERLKENLSALDVLVADRLEAAERKRRIISDLSKTNTAVQRALAPGIMVMDAKFSQLNKAVKDTKLNTEERLAVIDELAALISTALPLQKARFEASAINDMLLRAASAETHADLEELAFPLRRSQKSFGGILRQMAPSMSERISPRAEELGEIIAGPDSLTDVRANELDLIASSEDLITKNTVLSRQLTALVDDLLARAKEDIATGNLEATSVQRFSTGILIAVVALSLISSALIVWLYVGRNLIARLTALSDSMLAIAAGNLRAPLPTTSGGDEISRMAEALVVFRDTAIEVEETNLRDIDAARRRLVDAIENSSEGFAFYAPNDQLVICNSRYKELLYPNSDIAIEPGMAFEAIIRSAAEGGHIVDAQGRIDEWVAERLAFHRNPGEPRLQHRKSGQWILVTERKTGDGGTVAIYSDITDLKQRETELTTKSNALEQLSNQLAKYLSPQIYDSIFSGRQEVKLTSQRKRLTVFFSDLVGFTETTEQLESEDLTRLLNQYLTEMSQIAIAHGATIDKYIGDAIVIFFGDPETLGVKEDAVACVKMAIAMRKRMQELERLWKDSGLEKPLRCRMGINTGLCTVGNFGSDDRMDYTIIGGGVNLAARLESACAPDEILISYETYAHVNDLIHCEERDKLSVKGIAQPVTTYQVVDLRENLGTVGRPIRARLPHFQLDADVTRMSVDEQREALAVLLDSAERLSSFGTKA